MAPPWQVKWHVLVDSILTVPLRTPMYRFSREQDRIAGSTMHLVTFELLLRKHEHHIRCGGDQKVPYHKNVTHVQAVSIPGHGSPPAQPGHEAKVKIQLIATHFAAFSPLFLLRMYRKMSDVWWYRCFHGYTVEVGSGIYDAKMEGTSSFLTTGCHRWWPSFPDSTYTSCVSCSVDITASIVWNTAAEEPCEQVSLTPDQEVVIYTLRILVSENCPLSLDHCSLL